MLGQERNVRSSALLAGLCAAGFFHSTAATASTDSRLPEPSPVATGYSHTLLLRPNGNLHGWGDNSYGQLGVGDNTRRDNPLIIPLNYVVAVAAGDRFSLALTVDGSLYSWGRNTDGQLGRGTPTTSTTANRTPVLVGNAGTWKAIAAGARHALGIQVDGSLWAWGYNGSGQLGMSGSPVAAPTRVGNGNDWIAISAGADFSIGLRADGTLYASGSNASGQLGIPAVNGSTSTFTKVGPNDHYRAVSAGSAHVVAIRHNGGLWTWGLNDKGQLGDGTTMNRNVATPIGSTLWRSVSAGFKHSLGITASGGRQGWGENTSGEAGLGNKNTVTSPSPGASGADYEFIAAGKSFSFGMKATGEFFMWGLGSSGQLGQGSGITTVVQPTAPWSGGPGDGWATDAKPGQITAGTSHSVAIRSDGRLETWGSNRDRQLGPDVIGLVYEKPSVRVSGNTWLAIAAGETQTLAVKADGTLWAWGGNMVGELGTRPTDGHVIFPTQVGTDNRWLKVAAHYADSFALRADGTLWGWGDGTNGQIGDGSTSMNPRRAPVQVGTGKVWVAMAVSQRNGYGITSDGKLWGWGKNNEGQLCNGASGDNAATGFAPAQIGSATSWLMVGTGDDVVMALGADGKISGCGANVSGSYQLGESNTAVLPSIVTTMTGLRGVQRFFGLAVGNMSTLAWAPGGATLGWGANSQGELGLARTTPIAPPSESFFFSTKKLAIGGTHTIHIEAFAGVRSAAGNNDDGELGDGTFNDHSSPVAISSGF